MKLRIRYALLLLSLALFLIWLAVTRSEDSGSPSGTTTEKSPGDSTLSLRNRPASHRTKPPHRGASPPAQKTPLPRDISLFLETLEDDDSEELLPRAQEQMSPAVMESLVLAYHLADATASSHRILRLLSEIRDTETLAAARDVISDEAIPPDDPVLLACATSIASGDGVDGIRCILERLNRITADESGQFPDEAGALIRCLSLVHSPDLEWFISRAAEGEWVATSDASRVAAIHALLSFPSIHTTSVLARLRDGNGPPTIRQAAADTLAVIQSQEPE